jgi:hypothetical protein
MNDAIKKYVSLSKLSLLCDTLWSEKKRILVEDKRRAFRQCR